METDNPLMDVHVNCMGPWPVPVDLLARGCRSVLKRQGIQEGEVSVTLLGDGDITALNQEYFGERRPTDVIAFSLHGPGDPVLGDVYIGYEQAERQASELGIALAEEVLRLAVHGTLHVLGFEHPEGDDRFDSDMFRIQEEIVRTIRESSAP
jgi:probable rRNA maturation factor